MKKKNAWKARVYIDKGSDHYLGFVSLRASEMLERTYTINFRADKLSACTWISSQPLPSNRFDCGELVGGYYARQIDCHLELYGASKHLKDLKQIYNWFDLMHKVGAQWGPECELAQFVLVLEQAGVEVTIEKLPPKGEENATLTILEARKKEYEREKRERERQEEKEKLEVA